MAIAIDYEGDLIDATITSDTNDLTYQLTETQNGTQITANFMSTTCQGAADSTTPNLKATCTTSHRIQIATNKPIEANTTLMLSTSASGFSLSFSVTFVAISKKNIFTLFKKAQSC